MDISNKMDGLLDPENLPKVQRYFNEVLSMTLTKIWGLGHHPDFHSQLQQAWNDAKGINDEMFERRSVIKARLEKEQIFVEWQEIVPKLIEVYPTLGEFIEAIHKSTPYGQEDVYCRLREWAENTFPLLTKAITDGKFDPKLRVTAIPLAKGPTV